MKLLLTLVLTACAPFCPPQPVEIQCVVDGVTVYHGGIHNEEAHYYVVLIDARHTARVPKGQCQKFAGGSDAAAHHVPTPPSQWTGLGR